jgi:ribosomal protein S18 acetylase RimI-like enzyme
LRWARLRGARKAWLQVIAANHGAVALYETMGFGVIYDYAYWRKGSGA